MSWGVPSWTAKKETIVEVTAAKNSIWKPIVGDRVEVRYRGREKYLPGIIFNVQADNTYDINYDDGGKEIGVKLALIKEARAKFNYKVYAARTEPSVLDLENFCLGRVMTDFEPVKSFQLPLRKGDIITIVAVSPEASGWSKAFDETGF